MTALISAGSFMKQAKVQGSVATQMEGKTEKTVDSSLYPYVRNYLLSEWRGQDVFGVELDKMNQ